MKDSDQLSPTHHEALQGLVAAIKRHRLLIPARILAEIVAPFGLLGSQTALFLHPLIPVDRWRTYTDLFTHEAAWSEFDRLLQRQER